MIRLYWFPTGLMMMKKAFNKKLRWCLETDDRIAGNYLASFWIADSR